jgi:hypothetical protein
MNIFENVEREACSPTTSSQRLQELAFQSVELAYLVAQNPQTHPELLEELYVKYREAKWTGRRIWDIDDYGMREWIVNPDYNPNIIQAITRHPNTPPELLQQLEEKYCQGEWVQGRDYYDDDEWIVNPSYNPDILQAITRHPNTNKTNLWWLGELFPQALIENPIFNETTFNAYITSDYYITNYFGTINALLQLKQVPQWILDTVKQSGTLQKRMAKHNTTSASQLEVLALDIDSDIRSCVASSPTVINMSVGILETLAQDTEIEVRRSLAYNENSPENVLEILAQDVEIDIRRLVAGNPNASTTCLRKLAEEMNQDEEICFNLASNPNSPIDLLREIFEKFGSTTKICCGLATNINTPRNILDVFASHPEVSVRCSLAHNRNLPTEIKELLLKDTDKKVIFACYHDSNPHTLKALAISFWGLNLEAYS